MSSSLKKKTLKGVIWSSIDRFSTAGINFAIGIVIARFLSPKEYGLIAMLSVFIALSQSVIDSGFSNALVREQKLSEKDLSTTFYFNFVIGIIMYFILYISAPFIADFYNSLELIHITRIISLTLFIGSLSIVQQAILTKRLDFKSQTKISLLSAVVSGFIGIYMAVTKWGVWALVGQTVSSSIIRLIMFWMIVKWFPKTRFSMDSFKTLFGYGSKLLLAGILETIYRNLYVVIIGKYFQSSVLGLYSRGEQMASYPATNITGVVQRVTFPILSQIQDDDERVKQSFFRILKALSFFVFPLMIYLVIISKPLIILLLTSKWIECVPVIQILSLSFMWYPVHILNLNILQVKGRSDLYLRIEFIKKIIGLIVLVTTLPYGFLVMCWGRVLYCYLELFINMHYTNKLLNIRNLDQIKLFFPILTYSFLMWLLIFPLTNFIKNDLLSIIVTTVLCVSYWAFILLKIEKYSINELVKFNKK